MAGTYQFSSYWSSERDLTEDGVTLALDSSSTSMEAAGAEVATTLHTMHIDWLHPLSVTGGPWRLDKSGLREYFELTNEWLYGEVIVRPVLDQRSGGKGTTVGIVKFFITPEGPLSWSYSGMRGEKWERVAELASKARARLDAAVTSDEFQAVGLLCRDLLIAIGRAVYTSDLLPMDPSVRTGDADAVRMIDDYVSSKLPGRRQKEIRDAVKSAFNLAVHLQHSSSASYGAAAVCVEATISLSNMIRIIQRS